MQKKTIGKGFFFVGDFFFLSLLEMIAGGKEEKKNPRTISALKKNTMEQVNEVMLCAGLLSSAAQQC